MFKALGIRDFRLMWAGGAISNLGSWLLVLAIPAHIFLVTRSLTATGLTLAADYLPLAILGPIAGVLTDRWDRRRILIATSLLSAMVVAVMLLGLAPGRYWIFYVALVAESSGDALAVPALRARIPAIVGTGPLLTSANSLSTGTSGVVRLIGGPIGGLLFAAFGVRVLIIADAISYLVAGVAMVMTEPDLDQAVADQAPARCQSSIRTILADLREGLGVLVRERSARALLPVSVIFLAANASLTAIVVAFGVKHLGGSGATGLLFSALGAGFLVGSPILRLTMDRLAARYLLFLTLAATAASYLLLFYSSTLLTALPAAVAVGLFGSMSLVIPQTTVQRVIPNQALGRISAVFLTGEAVATLAGALAGPLLAQAIQIHGLAVVASLATAGGAVLTIVLLAPRPPAVPGAG